MPLLDHFHPPLRKQRPPEGFHNSFAATISDHLNLNVLSEQYLCEFQICVGKEVGKDFEVDIGTYDKHASFADDEPGGGTATAVAAAPVWAPPAPLLEMPVEFPDSLEIRVLDMDNARELVAAIEIVSLSNKDRPKTRRAFAAKCATYLHQGIGLITIDIVTNRRANLHNELIDLLEASDDYKMAPKAKVYAVAYRPVRFSKVGKIDIWPAALKVGERLPLLPLPLGAEDCVPLDLEVTYMEACRRSRLAAR